MTRMAANHELVHRQSSPEVKIALFRSLFRGREDVYPRRFESRKSGKSGYQPACGNEWTVGLCHKPRIKCADCQHRKFLPVTDDVIRWHLSGQDPSGHDFVIGVYPMLLDETCFFLAADLDKAGWQQDAAAVLETCRRLNVPAFLERSRSGNGGHVWLFFEEAVPAALARRLGSFLLTETMEFRPDIGLDSYDRFFPNQDTLPQGGFGNLIALPLQKRPRNLGNSVFLDEQGLPFPDQWVFPYQRPETLPETAGRFRLNVQLPIPIDSWGHMEVDLPCSDARVAIELDGGQHLASAEAYRRDRRKDAFLQEHGYFVLRFLAEDVGQHLDAVLDAILRALAHRRGR